MSSPYNAGRDSIGGTGSDFGVQGDIQDEHLSAFRQQFSPPSDQLSEQDYRTSDHRGSDVGTEDVTPHRGPRQLPQQVTYPRAEAGGEMPNPAHK